MQNDSFTIGGIKTIVRVLSASRYVDTKVLNSSESATV